MFHPVSYVTCQQIYDGRNISLLCDTAVDLFRMSKRACAAILLSHLGFANAIVLRYKLDHVTILPYVTVLYRTRISTPIYVLIC